MTVLYYMLQRDCRLERRSNLVELAPLLDHPRARTLLVGSGAEVGERRAADSPPGPRTTLVENGAGPPLRITLSPEEVAHRLDALRRQRRRCRDCLANRYPWTFAGEQMLGCVGTIELPISGATERALLAIVEALLEDSAEIEPTVTLPIRFIWDNGLDGERVRELRTGRSDLFEEREPVVARIGPFLEKQQLDTDQFLSLFILPGLRHGPELHLFASFAAEFVHRARSAAPEVTALRGFLPFFDSLASASDLGVGVEVVFLAEATAEASKEEQPTGSARTTPPPPPPPPAPTSPPTED